VEVQNLQLQEFINGKSMKKIDGYYSIPVKTRILKKEETFVPPRF
jgi:hypothetical protein